MLSIIWRNKRDSPETSKVFEIFDNRDNFKSEDGYFSSENHLNSYTFLQFCHLCHKPLRDTEIFMYRGEMGFCSEECRNRQMYLDDMKKIEISTRRILASFRERRRHSGSRCETRGIKGVAPPVFILK